jgi:hypothetical protein
LDNTWKSVKPWVTFAGVVLVVAVLYWAQAVLVPWRLGITSVASWNCRAFQVGIRHRHVIEDAVRPHPVRTVEELTVRRYSR